MVKYLQSKYFVTFRIQKLIKRKKKRKKENVYNLFSFGSTTFSASVSTSVNSVPNS